MIKIKQKKIKISLSTLLLIGIILSVILLFSVLLTIFYNQNRRVSESASRQIIISTSAEVVREVQQFISNAETRLNSLNDFFDFAIDIEERDDILLTLTTLLKSDHLVNALYYADMNGYFYMAKRMLDNSISNRIVKRDDNKITSTWIHETPSLAKKFPLHREDNLENGYDPRTRPWYTIAQKDIVTWTSPYIFYSDKKIGITGTKLIQQGKHQGVIAVDISLEYLESFIKELQFSQYGQILLSNNKNQIIAYSRHTSEISSTKDIEIMSLTHVNIVPELQYIIDEVNRNPIIDNSENEGIFDILMRVFSSNDFNMFDSAIIKSNNSAIRSYPYAQKKYLYSQLQFSQFNGIDWKIHINSSSENIIGNIDEVIKLGLGILILIFLIVLSFIYHLSKRITSPIVHLSDLMARLKYLDLAVSYSESRKMQINELSSMGDIYNSVRKSLVLFKKFVPKAIIKQAMLQGEEMKALMRSHKNISFLFSDIVGFTTITEEHSPQSLSHALNIYFTVLTAVIYKYDGIIDKFIGDAIMAMFGIFDENNTKLNSAEQACKSALIMQRVHEQINEKIKIYEGISFHTRIGINTGDALIGLLGSDTKLNFTAIGDNVNLASRLEGLNKEYETNIIISEWTKNQLNKNYITKYLGTVKVKGKSEETKIYQLISHKPNQQNRK